MQLREIVTGIAFVLANAHCEDFVDQEAKFAEVFDCQVGKKKALHQVIVLVTRHARNFVENSDVIDYEELVRRCGNIPKAKDSN
jgi:hypothetical protein